MAQLVQRVAAKVIIQVKNGILVLHPSSIDQNRNWHIPGGMRDEQSEPLWQTGVREVREETGIDIAACTPKLHMIGEWTGKDKDEKVSILAVFYHVVLPAQPAITLSHEHDDYAWITIKDHTNYQASPEVHQVVQQILG